MTADLKLVVFDLGGTLIEDAGHVPAAFQAALAAHGHAVSEAEIAGYRGASKREVPRPAKAAPYAVTPSARPAACRCGSPRCRRG